MIELFVVIDGVYVRPVRPHGSVILEADCIDVESARIVGNDSEISFVRIEILNEVILGAPFPNNLTACRVYLDETVEPKVAVLGDMLRIATQLNGFGGTNTLPNNR